MAQATILDHTLVVRLLPGVAIGAVITGHPVQVVRQAAHDERSWILTPTATDLLAPVACARALQGVTGVEYAHPVLLPPLALQGTPTDPLFPQQYHLSDGGIADVDVSTVWNYVTGNGLGRGVTVTVVDSGMEPHPDLGANLRADLGYSYRESQTASLLGANDSHGEFVGGLIAAQGYNGLGGVGVAPGATLIPVQVVGTRLSPGVQQPDAVEAALTHLLSPVSADPTIRTWVSNNSWAWGPGSQGAAVLFPSWATALDNGIHQGRCGRGIVYCFAAGNNDYFSVTDPTSGHNANYDQWVSNRRVLAVGAIDETAGQGRFFYSQSGCGLFCVAPGGNTWDWRTSRFINKGIVSLDRAGTNGWVSGDYTAPSDYQQGTSFAAPLVAGVVALVLEANPRLTYRDVMHLIANHAVPCDTSDEFLTDANRALQPAFRQPAQVRSWKRWQSNGAVPARNHSVRYGFGRIAAAKAVRAAHSWVSVPASATPITATASIPARAISDATTTDVTPGTGQATITVAGAAPAFAIEHVELHVQVTHPAIGQLSYLLTSPSGSTSFIERRPNDAAANLDYTFTSVAHWGETPNGTWQLRVYDWVSGQTGTLENASLTIHGHLPYPTPAITAISPATLPAGSASVAITLTGSGFARN
ncbi:MAG: S8 family serine peptidase, partial [Planctomycetes bacterium]|nr:S8 family serine peptidase [Planctomycetota bacterium]